ncbi:efflux RND transporter periplasmic adaptor subunit [Paenibacillus azoreducens]|uniref:RND transporter n=1 Tax=Paenibacillus azoreducens TaxID=116718 RepID=A0A919Y5X1_9BACL|nr:biotin/lipoyl-binding protein [Paenibacillus azoreducens]GIO45242.1 RND transporter [Paenibacillus azoreducens]
MELGKEQADQKRKRIILLVFAFFVGLLLFFTFFSNTLQSLTLPKVGTEKPEKGSIAVTVEGSGVLTPVSEVKLMNTTGWKVKKVFVKEGDHVKKGQKLILYDSMTAEQELNAEITNLEKQKVEQQNTQDRYIESALEEDELKLRNAKREIEKGKLDIAAQERKIDEMKTSLASKNQLTAPFDGIVTKVNAMEGFAPAGDPDVVMINSSLGYRLKISADAKLLLSLGIKVGEEIDVDVDKAKSQQSETISGVIEDIVSADARYEDSSGEETVKAEMIPQKTLRIKVTDPGLKGGEQASVKFEKNTLDDGLLVSNKAVHEDREGKYVFKVEEQRGALGNAFIARKVKVETGGKNDKETMITQASIYDDDVIILESSEPLQDGDRVRLQ